MRVVSAVILTVPGEMLVVFIFSLLFDLFQLLWVFGKCITAVLQKMERIAFYQRYFTRMTGFGQIVSCLLPLHLARLLVAG